MEKIGKFQIIKELGRGGMATVYLAYDPGLKRKVAIKVLPKLFMHDKKFIGRFKREAKTIAGLNHPAIVPVFEFGEFDEQPYLVLGYMPGLSLAEKLNEKMFDIRETVAFVKRLSGGLDYIHRKGFVHRDIKPGNILFDDQNLAYIADFGIVKGSEMTMTLTMGIVGTPAYMSPEQAEGLKELDARSDQYSLGVILYLLLSGRVPFQAETPAGLIYAQIHKSPESISKIN